MVGCGSAAINIRVRTNLKFLIERPLSLQRTLCFSERVSDLVGISSGIHTTLINLNSMLQSHVVGKKVYIMKRFPSVRPCLLNQEALDVISSLLFQLMHFTTL